MKNVLIVDDDSVFLDVLMESLDQYSNRFHVITAENGQQAIDILEKEEVSLLVTDIVMPEVDGLTLLAYVNDRHLAIPCFVMTAFGTQAVRSTIPKDVLNFFHKPFPAGKLGPAIESALEQGVPTGVVSGITVASFLLLVEMEKKTCLFEIDLPDGSKGVCYFNKGVLFNAAFKGIKGEDAIHGLIRNEKARFRFKPLPEKKLARRINKEISVLIGEARQQGLADTQEFTVNDIISEGKKQLHRLKLAGTYKSSEAKVRGTMTVVNISINHIVFITEESHMLQSQSRLSLEFALDDKLSSRIQKEVVITDADKGQVRCEFIKPEHYDRLGPYLHFNKLDKQSL